MYRKSNLRIFLILLIVLSVGFSIGYAYLNTTLTINGTSTVQKNTWDTHFDNIKIKEGSVTANIEPTVESGTKISRFDLVLQKPGDYYEFTVDVVNSGTLDAMVSNIVKTPDLTSSQQKYLDYKIEYENGEQITTKQLVKVEEFVRVKVRVEYKKDIQPEDLPTELDLVSLGFEINYEQADDTGTSVKDNGVFRIVANGSLDDIGTIVTIGSEQFYTIGTEGDNVKLLSMYNLYVGGSYQNNVYTAYGNEATGMQSENMIGFAIDQSVENGLIEFSKVNSDYNGSVAQKHVNSYKDKLTKKFGVDIIEARLITLTELLDQNTFNCKTGTDYCSDKYPWIYSTTYWTQTSHSFMTEHVYGVHKNGDLEAYYYKNNIPYGIRPVIIISKSDIEVDVKPVANGDINEIGTIVTIGNQQFYTIGTEGDNVKLLSMYNLYVGGEYFSSWTAYGSEVTGKQDSTMLGYVDGQSVRKGTTAFSSDTQKGTNYSDYSGSIVEGYVNNYKSIIESEYGVDVAEVRLIDYDELITLGCSRINLDCFSAPNWVYATSYWSGSAFSSDSVWYVYSTGGIDSDIYSSKYFGVRPVIVISKSYF